MEPMSSAEIRERFQRFFEERGHTRVPPAPLLAKDDPTLLFVNSGMAPFKRVLTGEEKRDYVRAVTPRSASASPASTTTSTTSARTPYHHTLLRDARQLDLRRLLQEDAIAWAWELLTEVWELDPERVCT